MPHRSDPIKPNLFMALHHLTVPDSSTQLGRPAGTRVAPVVLVWALLLRGAAVDAQDFGYLCPLGAGRGIFGDPPPSPRISPSRGTYGSGAASLALASNRRAKLRLRAAARASVPSRCALTPIDEHDAPNLHLH